MGEVVDIDCITTLDISSEKVLTKAANADLKTAVVIGYNQDGDFYFASTTSDGGDVLWLLEIAKRELITLATE